MKLKQLSIVSLASSRRVCVFHSSAVANSDDTVILRYQILPYTTLLTYLDIGSIRELEDLIIDAMYQDMLQGKLDQKEQQFEIEYTMGRDLEPGQTEKLLVALNDWCVAFPEHSVTHTQSFRPK